MVGVGLTTIVWSLILGNLVSEYAKGKREKAKAIKATKYGSSFPTIIQS